MKDMVSVCEDAKYLLLQISSLGLDSQMKDRISSTIGDLNRSIDEHRSESKINVERGAWPERLKNCPEELQPKAAELYMLLEKARTSLFAAQEKFEGHKKSPLIGQASELYRMRCEIGNMMMCVVNGNLV